jgi:hypothetical protein
MKIIEPRRHASPKPDGARRGRGCGVSRARAGRAAASFGLHGAWRLSAQPPAAQAALLQAIDECRERTP